MTSKILLLSVGLLFIALESTSGQERSAIISGIDDEPVSIEVVAPNSKDVIVDDDSEPAESKLFRNPFSITMRKYRLKKNIPTFRPLFQIASRQTQQQRIEKLVEALADPFACKYCLLHNIVKLVQCCNIDVEF
jgi:hypothetical protein